MHLLDKINSWVQSGPMGNDKQLDPVTIAALGIAGAKTIGGFMDEANEKKARDSFLEEYKRKQKESIQCNYNIV